MAGVLGVAMLVGGVGAGVKNGCWSGVWFSILGPFCVYSSCRMGTLGCWYGNG